MKNVIKIFLYVFTWFGVITCALTKEDQLNKSGGPHTKIIESIYDISGPIKEFTSNTSPEEISEVFNNDLHDHLIQKFLTKLRGVDSGVYGNIEKESMHYDNGLGILRSKSHLPMDTPELINSNLYPKLTAVRPLPAMDNLPPVYWRRPHAKLKYHEEEPLYYNSESLHSLNPILIPVDLRQLRTTSEEDFWSQLSEDAILKNIIPTMEVPMPRPSKYNQLFHRPIPLSASEYMNNNSPQLYSERDLRDYTY